MKKIFFAALLFISACSSEKNTPPIAPPPSVDMNQLYGSWKYDEIQVSTSQLAEIQQAVGRVIEYRRDSTFTLAVPSYSSDGRFRLDANRILMDGGFFDEQTKEVTELTPTVFRAQMQVRSDDGGVIRIIGEATFKLSKP